MCFQKPLRDFALQNQVASQSAEMWCVFLLSPIETGTLNKHLLQTVPHDSETVTWGNSSLNNSIGTLTLLTLSLSRTSRILWNVNLAKPPHATPTSQSCCHSYAGKLPSSSTSQFSASNRHWKIGLASSWHKSGGFLYEGWGSMLFS